MIQSLIKSKSLESKNFLILISGFFLLLIVSIIGFLQPPGNIMWNGEGKYYIYSCYIDYWSVIQYGLIIIPAMLILAIGVLFTYQRHKNYPFAISSLLYFVTFLIYIYWFLYMPPNWSIEDTGFVIEMLVSFEFFLGLGIISINISIFFFGLGMVITKNIRKPAKGLSICILISTTITMIFFIWIVLNQLFHSSFGLGWQFLIRDVNMFLMIICILNLFALFSEISLDHVAK